MVLLFLLLKHCISSIFVVIAANWRFSSHRGAPIQTVVGFVDFLEVEELAILWWFISAMIEITPEHKIGGLGMS